MPPVAFPLGSWSAFRSAGAHGFRASPKRRNLPARCKSLLIVSRPAPGEHCWRPPAEAASAQCSPVRRGSEPALLGALIAVLSGTRALQLCSSNSCQTARTWQFGRTVPVHPGGASEYAALLPPILPITQPAYQTGHGGAKGHEPSGGRAAGSRSLAPNRRCRLCRSHGFICSTCSGQL